MLLHLICKYIEWYVDKNIINMLLYYMLFSKTKHVTTKGGKNETDERF